MSSISGQASERASSSKTSHDSRETSTLLSAPSLLQEHHGDALKALHAAVQAHNALAAAETERARVASENRKVWSWSQNLKRERDSLLKDRDRLVRKVQDLRLTLKSNGIETTDADTEEELSTSQSTSNLVRPSGPYRSRSGEVLLRENHGRDRTRSNQTVSTSSSTFTSSSQQSHHSQYDSPKESLFSESSRGSPKTISSTSDSANAPGESPSGDGVGRSLRRKASSVDLGNPSAATTPKMQHQSPIQGGHPSTPPQAPKYTLNGFEISSSPFNPAFPPSHRMSSLPPPRHHQPTSGAEDNASPIPVGTPRPGRSGSDSAARDNTRLGLGISPSNSKSQPRQPSKASSLPPGPQDFMETPPNEHDEHALFNTPSSINTSDSSTRRKGPDSTISASSSRSSNLLDSPEVERRYNRHAQSASSLNKERDIQRPAPIKVAEGSGKQSPADASKAGSALSPGLPPTPTTQQESSMPMSTLKNFKLDPTHLGLCKIRVTSSQIRMNDKAREVILFFITVSLPLASSSNPDASSSLVHWTVEKYFSDFIQLDTTVKSKHGKNITKKIASLPDKSLFKDHAPSKVDTRKAILQKYLRSLVEVSLDKKEDLCQFLTTNVTDERNTPVANPASKAGYLTKKGRLIGGWQTRYYVLQGPSLEYYESQGGPHLGHIDVTGAQIGRQQQPKESNASDMYRHAFLIRENKRSKPNDTGTDVDHVLCAESDTERDDWVRVLAAWGTGHYIQPDEANNQTPNAAPSQVVQPDVSASATAPAAQSAPRRPSSQSRKLSKEDIAKGTAQPLPSVSPSEPQLNKLYTGVHQPYSLQKATHRREDSAGRASVDSNTSQQADLEPMLHQRIAKKREHIHEMPSSSSLPANLDSYTPPQQHRPNSQQSHHADSALSSQASQRPVSPSKASSSKISGPMNGQLIGTANFKPSRADRQNKVKSSFWNFARSDKHPAVVAAQAKPVFGVPLEEAVQRARVKDGFELPAVVFRCVEYLQAKSAVSEEGLYRLSGSTNVIKGLKDKFNMEGDYNLLASGEYHDPHAIAGLLKLFLRELPVTVLTRELQPYFLQVVDLAQRKDKVNELGSLVSQLPVANYTLLRFLAAHLSHVVDNEHINKMSLRNIGIVFSPTLAVPATLFNLFLTEFSLVFRTLDDRPAPVVLEDEDVADPDSRASHVSADTSIETITNDRHGRRQSRNSIYYASSGADRLLEPHTKVLTESEETDTDSGEGPLDLEKASLTSSGVEVDALRQLAPPHATLGTAPPPSSPHRHIHKNPGLSVTTTGRGTPGLPSSPRERSPVSPLSPHSQSQLTQ